MRVEILPEGRVLFWANAREFEQVVDTMGPLERIGIASMSGIPTLALDFPRGKYIVVLEDEATKE